MSVRKKGTRRNFGGRRNSTPPPFYFGGPSVHELKQGMEATRIAMQIATRVNGAWR